MQSIHKDYEHFLLYYITLWYLYTRLWTTMYIMYTTKAPCVTCTQGLWDNLSGGPVIKHAIYKGISILGRINFESET